MSVLPVCGLSHIYATQNALSLMEDYCACPAALDVLKQITVPLTVEMRSDLLHSAHMVPGLSSDFKLREAKILISDSDKFNQEPALSQLAFEISNVIEENEFMPFRRSSENGNVGMDHYAQALELSEINSTKNTYALQSKCNNYPGFNPSKLGQAFNQLSVEEHLWYQELDCHTDSYRIQWVKQLKNKYCQKHPADVKSCHTTVTDLCDMNELNALPKEKYNILIHKRICERFSTSPPYFQKQFLPIIEEACPEVKPAQVNYTHILLNSAITVIIALLAAKCFSR